MKPRTKYQKQVVTSNKGLRPIKGAQMQWAFRECLDHYAFQLKHGQTTCMDCGHTWTTDEDADKCVCPKCKAKLEVQRTKRQKAMSSTYFSVLTERKGLQLMRAYQMKAYYRKGQKADIYCWEVARYWMNEKGKVEVMARKRTMGIYMDTFCYDSDIELRKDNTTYQHIASFPVCPDMKVIPQIWRNGFDGAFHGIEPLTLFKAMLTDHRIETMMKQCRYGHVRHFIDHPRHLETCWNAYKIANRNHYLITDIGKWADYICMLVEMGKDIRSPHYICPDNLEAEHDRISEKIRAKKEKERTEEEIRKALKNEDKDGNYRELHTKQAAECINYNVEDNYRTEYTPQKNQGVSLVQCPYFNTAVYDLDEPMTIDYSELDSFVILIGLKGEGTITDNEGNTTTLRAGESILVPATTETLKVEGNVKFLETYV